MLRKIILTYTAPKFLAAGRKTRALQLYNYADNMMLSYIMPDDKPCFYNYFFSCLYHDCNSKDIENYITRVNHPINQLDIILNNGGYTNSNYLNDIAGTVCLRERNYKKAMQFLSKVSLAYEKQLNTYSCLRRNPFGQYRLVFVGYDNINNKYNFAEQMNTLEQLMNNKSVDINLRADAKLQYAIGMKNSYLSSWAYTQYGQGYPVFTDSYREWMDKGKKESIIHRYEQLVASALQMYTNEESAARAQYKLNNLNTIVTQYPNTIMSSYVKGHCDSYYDYHLERVEETYQPYPYH